MPAMTIRVRIFSYKFQYVRWVSVLLFVASAFACSNGADVSSSEKALHAWDGEGKEHDMVFPIVATPELRGVDPEVDVDTVEDDLPVCFLRARVPGKEGLKPSVGAMLKHAETLTAGTQYYNQTLEFLPPEFLENLEHAAGTRNPCDAASQRAADFAAIYIRVKGARVYRTFVRPFRRRIAKIMSFRSLAHSNVCISDEELLAEREGMTPIWLLPAPKSETEKVIKTPDDFASSPEGTAQNIQGLADAVAILPQNEGVGCETVLKNAKSVYFAETDHCQFTATRAKTEIEQEGTLEYFVPLFAGASDEKTVALLESPNEALQIIERLTNLESGVRYYHVKSTASEKQGWVQEQDLDSGGMGCFR